MIPFKICFTMRNKTLTIIISFIFNWKSRHKKRISLEGKSTYIDVAWHFTSVSHLPRTLIIYGTEWVPEWNGYQKSTTHTTSLKITKTNNLCENILWNPIFCGLEQQGNNIQIFQKMMKIKSPKSIFLWSFKVVRGGSVPSSDTSSRLWLKCT